MVLLFSVHLQTRTLSVLGNAWGKLCTQSRCEFHWANIILKLLTRENNEFLFKTKNIFVSLEACILHCCNFNRLSKVIVAGFPWVLDADPGYKIICPKRVKMASRNLIMPLVLRKSSFYILSVWFNLVKNSDFEIYWIIFQRLMPPFDLSWENIFDSYIIKIKCSLLFLKNEESYEEKQQQLMVCPNSSKMEIFAFISSLLD